jgi:hypothetical protein
MGSQVIQINFSETIQAGVNYSKITLLNSSNKIMPITEKIYGNSLYITSMNKYTHGTIYTLIIPLNSIKDLRGNILSTTYKTSFKVEQTPPKLISTTPSNLKMGFSRTADITIKFNELIQSSVNFNKITVKNLTTNKNITFSKIYFYENIIITTPTRAPNTWYQVTIPTTAIQDWAGNQQKTPHIFKFRTGT